MTATTTPGTIRVRIDRTTTVTYCSATNSVTVQHGALSRMEIAPVRYTVGQFAATIERVRQWRTEGVLKDYVSMS